MLMGVTNEAETLLIALIERVKSVSSMPQGNVFRLEQDLSNGAAELAQPHIDHENVKAGWRIETYTELVDQLCCAHLLEKAPSGVRITSDRQVIRAGISIAAFHWYEKRTGS